MLKDKVEMKISDFTLGIKTALTKNVTCHLNFPTKNLKGQQVSDFI